MNRLTILDDNLEFSRNLLNYIIDKNKKIVLSSLAITGEEVLKAVQYLTKDDILLLDLGLPTINGLEVIDNLRKNTEHLPHIIVMSGNPQLLEQIHNYVPYIYTVMEKPFSFRRMLEIIERIINESEQRSYEHIIKQELQKFEVNVTTIGYAYIIESITLLLEDETLIKDMKNRLYKIMSVKNRNITPNNIKWALEKCVKSIIRFTSTKVIREYFHVEAREKVTPKLFLSTIVDNLQNQIQENREEKEAYYY